MLMHSQYLRCLGSGSLKIAITLAQCVLLIFLQSRVEKCWGIEIVIGPGENILTRVG